MATIAELKAFIAAQLPDNVIRIIKPINLRNALNAMVDEFQPIMESALADISDALATVTGQVSTVTTAAANAQNAKTAAEAAAVMAEAAAAAATGLSFVTFAGTSLTLSGTYYGKTIVTTSSSAVTISLPANAAKDVGLRIIQGGTGQVTFNSLSSIPLHQPDGYTKTAKRWASVILGVMSNSDGSTAEWVADGYMAA